MVREPLITLLPPKYKIIPIPSVKKKVVVELLLASNLFEAKVISESSSALTENFPFSYSSAANAFTTGIPDKFS